jgi:hypothetical protein
LGNTLSTESRIHKEIGNIIARETGLDYSPDLDLNSIGQRMPKVYSRPVYNILVQRMPQKSSLPVLNLKIEIQFMVEGSQGEDMDVLFRELLDNYNSVDNVLLTTKTAKKLNTKRIISNGYTNRVRNNNIEIIGTYTTYALQQGEEYKIL